MIYGAIVGAVTANLLRSALTGGWINTIGFGAVSIDVSGVPWPEFWPIVLGLLFVLVTLFLPRGIMGLWHDIVGLVWQRLFKARLVEGATPPHDPDDEAKIRVAGTSLSKPSDRPRSNRDVVASA